MSPDNVTAVLELMLATWQVGGRPSTEAEMDIWRDVLSPLSYVVAEDCVRNVLSTELQFFPTVKDFRAGYREHEKRMAERERKVRRVCPECSNNPSCVVDVSPEGALTPTVRPCSRCAPVQYQLWAGGHRQPDHSCSMCKDLRSNNTSVRDRAEEKLMDDYKPFDLATPSYAEEPF